MFKIENVNKLHVYEYEHLDDLGFVRSPAEVMADLAPGELTADGLAKLIVAVGDHLKAKGWEGDGTIGIMWLPPFVDVGVGDTYGTYVWHVKQGNNGTSWLASRDRRPFNRLQEQNLDLPWETHVPLGALFSECSHLLGDSSSLVTELKQRTGALSTAKVDYAEEIAADLLESGQGKLVAVLQEFLDDCYLQVLRHVFEEGNPRRLDLGKFKATLNPSVHTSGERPDAEGDQWFTMVGLIKDIWHGYKFEPFDGKTQMLFRALDYKLDPALRLTIKTHVELRNCVQHHEGRLTADAVQRLGLKEITFRSADGSPTKLKPPDRIVFTVPELENLVAALVTLVRSFQPHAAKKLRETVWVPREEVAASPLADLYEAQVRQAAQLSRTR